MIRGADRAMFRNVMQGEAMWMFVQYTDELQGHSSTFTIVNPDEDVDKKVCKDLL